jgi:hypothetical protein
MPARAACQAFGIDGRHLPSNSDPAVGRPCYDLPRPARPTLPCESGPSSPRASAHAAARYPKPHPRHVRPFSLGDLRCRNGGIHDRALCGRCAHSRHRLAMHNYAGCSTGRCDEPGIAGLPTTRRPLAPRAPAAMLVSWQMKGCPAMLITGHSGGQNADGTADPPLHARAASDDGTYQMIGRVLDYWIVNDLRNILRQQGRASSIRAA